MRILFFAPRHEDYLADSLLHGLKCLLGSDVVDVPKAARLYRSYPPTLRKRLYGNGFTLYGLLPDEDIDRTSVVERIKKHEFDLVIIGDIHREYKTFVNLRHLLNITETAILDGADTTAPFPYAGRWWRTLEHFRIPNANAFLYYKRELTSETLSYRFYRLVPSNWCSKLEPRSNWRKISFSIPEEKIVHSLPFKTRMFTSHIVDPEVAAHLPQSSTNRLFESEEAYYEDLRSARFGITVKRAGWDCLRHYEIAASACVPCFRQLNMKEHQCAPHGLSTENCIIYQTFDDLRYKISQTSERAYARMQAAALLWARSNSTAARAAHFLTSVSQWQAKCAELSS